MNKYNPRIIIKILFGLAFAFSLYLTFTGINNISMFIKGLSRLPNEVFTNKVVVFSIISFILILSLFIIYFILTYLTLKMFKNYRIKKDVKQ